MKTTGIYKLSVIFLIIQSLYETCRKTKPCHLITVPDNMQRAALTAKSTINSSPADTLTSVTVEQHQACGWTEVKAWVNLRNDRQLQYKWSKSAANYDKMHSLEVLKKWSFRLISLRKICSLTVCSLLYVSEWCCSPVLLLYFSSFLLSHFVKLTPLTILT